ncbi:distal tail protein Dit [Geobacillus thermodenitrificans]|jgi:phage-related protein|uniref:distal tail protein Dit n=1 Tax=Geobacillus thermodenitrificans TaxID=33940 RepID=UPI003D240201
MIQRLDFSYDGISSLDMGVIQVSLEGGLFKETFVANKKINEVSIRGREKPYFFGTERDPLSFPLTIYFEDGFDENKIRNVARWLDQDFYKPFYFLEDPNKIYYAMTLENSEFIHNGIRDGFITLNFRCNSPYAYSPVTTKTYDFSNNTSSGTQIIINNYGDLECKPLLAIEPLEDGDISIVNLSDNNKEFKFTGLKKGEIVTIDNEKELIESSLSYVWRYENFNNNYLSLKVDENKLNVYGKCKLTFKYQFKYKTLF